jgi:fermentation-respiration switch protein FrsA (DUF1100 family)
MVIGTPEVITEHSSAIDREFFDYYRTPRGHHPRSTTAMSLTSGAAMSLFWSFEHLDWISPRPVLFITDEQAHSRIFSEHAFKKASEPKELYIVPGAGHAEWGHCCSLPRASEEPLAAQAVRGLREQEPQEGRSPCRIASFQGSSSA